MGGTTDKKFNCNKCEEPKVVVVPTCTEYCDFRVPAICTDINTSEIDCVEEDSITLQEFAEIALCATGSSQYIETTHEELAALKETE